MPTKYFLVEGPLTAGSFDEFPDKVWKAVTSAPGYGHNGWFYGRFTGLRGLIEILKQDTAAIETLDIVGHGNPESLSIGETYVSNGGVMTASKDTYVGLGVVASRFVGATVRCLGCATGARGPVGDWSIDGRAMLFALASYLSCTVKGPAGAVCVDDFASGLFAPNASLPLAAVTPDSVGTVIDDVNRACGTFQPTPPADLVSIHAVLSRRVQGLAPTVAARDLLVPFDQRCTYGPELRGGGRVLATAVARRPGKPPVTMTLFGAGHCVRLAFPPAPDAPGLARELWLRRKLTVPRNSLAHWGPLIAKVP